MWTKATVRVRVGVRVGVGQRAVASLRVRSAWWSDISGVEVELGEGIDPRQAQLVWLLEANGKEVERGEARQLAQDLIRGRGSWEAKGGWTEKGIW